MASPSSRSSVSPAARSQGDLSLVHGQDAVRQVEDLVQLEGDEQHGPAGVALLDQPPVDELDRSDVEAARRLCGEQHAWRGLDLPGQHELLLVPARQRARAGVRSPRRGRRRAR